MERLVNARIFEYTDCDGDSMGVFLTHFEDRDEILEIAGNVYLTPAAVDQLRAALKPYGTQDHDHDPIECGCELTPEDAPRKFRPVVGHAYRLLPGARNADGPSALLFDKVTAVYVSGGPDEDGDYAVRPIDGGGGFFDYFVKPEYLAPLD